MSTHVTATFGIVTADTAIEATLNTPLDGIPIFRFGTKGGSAALALWFDGPVEQATWLRRFVTAAEDLIEQVERRAAEVANEALAVRSA